MSNVENQMSKSGRCRRDHPVSVIRTSFDICLSTFAIPIAGAGIEPAPPGSEPSVTASSNYPADVLREESPESRVRFAQILNPCPWPLASDSNLRGQESNLRTRRSKRRISTSRNYPASKEGRVGLEPTHWCLTGTCSAAELPTQSALRESNPPVQLGRLAPLPLGQGHMCNHQKRKPWDSNPQRDIVSAPVFETGSSSSRMTSTRCQLRRQESNLRRGD